MKTTIDIPDDVLEQSMKFTGAKTKRDAVVSAMKTFNHRKRAEAFIKRIEEGPPLDFPTNDEIEGSSESANNRAFNYFHPDEDSKA